jgi:hypothetical protein
VGGEKGLGMGIYVDPATLAASGAGLAGTATPVAPGPEAVGSAADPVSAAAGAILSAHWSGLSATVAHGQLVREAGGAALIGSGAALKAADAANADFFGGGGAGAGALAAAAGVVSPALPDVPAVPGLGPPPVLPGEVWSRLLHSGGGSAGWRASAAQLRAQASGVGQGGSQTAATAHGVSAAWDDDGQGAAAASVRRHADWLDGAASDLQRLAGAYEQCAGHHDRAVSATPPPEQFAQVRQAALDASARGDLAGYSAATTQFSDLQAQSSEAMLSYYGDTSAVTAALPASWRTAPPITGGDDDGATPLDDKQQRGGQTVPKPLVKDPSELGPANIPGHPWVEVGDHTGVWLDKSQLKGVVITDPGALGPSSTAMVPGGTDYVELLPKSGVWLPKDSLPGSAYFADPGGLGPSASGFGGSNLVEWIPGSGIYLPRNAIVP